MNTIVVKQSIPEHWFVSVTNKIHSICDQLYVLNIILYCIYDASLQIRMREPLLSKCVPYTTQHEYAMQCVYMSLGSY